MSYRNNILVFDFETSGKNCEGCQPTQLAAIIVSGRTGKIVKGSEFNSLIKIEFDEEKCNELGVDLPEDKALEITKKTKEELDKAPTLDVVWKNFSAYVEKYNIGKGAWDKPIPAGFNIKNFDMPLIRRIAGETPWEYGPFDKTAKRCTLFHPVTMFDVYDDVKRWLEWDSTVKSISMDSLRKKFGIRSDNAHDALNDVIVTATFIEKFIALYRFFGPQIEFDNSFAAHAELGVGV